MLFPKEKVLLLQSNGIHICYLLSEWFVQKKKKKKEQTTNS